MAEQLICNHQVVGSIPIDGTKMIFIGGHSPPFHLKGCVLSYAPMAELADALDLGSSEATRTGSIPARCTKQMKLPPFIGLKVGLFS